MGVLDGTAGTGCLELLGTHGLRAQYLLPPNRRDGVTGSAGPVPRFRALKHNDDGVRASERSSLDARVSLESQY